MHYLVVVVYYHCFNKCFCVLQLPVAEGVLKMNGEIAYVSQQAWLFSGTVRDNILFGECDDDPERLDRVVEACALAEDLASMDGGLDAVIGEQGAGLSGGQKQVLRQALFCAHHFRTKRPVFTFSRALPRFDK